MLITLNNDRYTIEVVEPDNENLLFEGKYRTGITYFVDKTIYIANNLNKYTLKYTLLHELTHAVQDSFGFLQVEWNDEIVADFMANYMDLIATKYNDIIGFIMEQIKND